MASTFFIATGLRVPDPKQFAISRMPNGITRHRIKFPSVTDQVRRTLTTLPFNVLGRQHRERDW